MKRYTGLFVIAICLVLGACKKKGCTDKNSLNYDVMADEDDGSCIYCDSVVTHVASKTLYLVDNYGGSLHFGQQILKIDLNQHADTFNYVQCGDNQCTISATFTSLVSQSMSVNFYINAGSPVFINRNVNLDMLPYATETMEEFAVNPLSDCVPISSASVTASLQTQPFYY